ncbi:MAG: S9 family peptidase [Ignavibacteria bacterium]|nr:S9 family peptidase [Ignavibacteria bacterium]
MNKKYSFIKFFTIIFSVLITLNSYSQEVEKIPLRDFFKNPDKTYYQISPNGEYLAYLAPYENRLNIFVQKIGSDEAVRVTNVTDRDLAGYYWANNDMLLFGKDKDGDENYHVFGVDKKGEILKDLTPFEDVKVRLVDPLEDIDDDVLISMNKRNKEIFDVYRLNIATGDLKIVAENPGNVTGWITDHNGNIRIARTTDGTNTSLLYRETEDYPFEIVLTTSFREALYPLFFTSDNKYIYASSNLGRDKSAIVMYDIANGKEMEVIFEHPEVDVYGLYYSKKKQKPVSISYTTWKRQREYLDEDVEKLFERLESELGTDYEIVITGISKNEDKFLVRTYSDRSLGTYYFYDLDTDKLTKLTDVSPWLNEDDLAEMKPISYKSRDGLTINGYLTLPKGKEPKNLPVVINPHGGPWARDSWGFNPEVQFLANRGFAVLQMNFRGSTGYGKAFWEASFKQWGRKMQDDITDGVNWLIEEGIADPNRIGIYGGSYGGYATLTGLTSTPDLYTCGVDYVGVSNLFTFFDAIPPYWKPHLEKWYEMVGNPEKDSLLFVEVSPVFHVDNIKAPLFVAQGKNDPRVNIEESNQIVEALKKKGIDVPYMVKEDEGHGFHNEENRFDFYEAMEKFLLKHLNPKVN